MILNYIIDKQQSFDDHNISMFKFATRTFSITLIFSSINFGIADEPILEQTIWLSDHTINDLKAENCKIPKNVSGVPISGIAVG